MDVALCCVAFSPSCCAMRLFMAGMRVSSDDLRLRNVAICCAPESCTSSPMTPSCCCAAQSCLMAATSAADAPILWFMTVWSCVSATICSWYEPVRSFMADMALLMFCDIVWKACDMFCSLIAENERRELLASLRFLLTSFTSLSNFFREPLSVTCIVYFTELSAMFVLCFRRVVLSVEEADEWYVGLGCYVSPLAFAASLYRRWSSSSEIGSGVVSGVSLSVFCLLSQGNCMMSAGFSL